MTRLRRILHLSDPHLTATGTDMDGVDARGALAGLLHDLRFLGALDLVVVSGDLADDGTVDGVRDVHALVGGYAAAHGAVCAYTTGNHDDRASFRSVLGTGLHDVDGSPVGDPGPGCAVVGRVDGLRIVTLDSLVPGAVHGVIGTEQLDWLAGVLRQPAPAGTLVALHHPPVTIATVPGMRGFTLHDHEALGEVLRGTDVRAVLAGHLHHQLSGSLAGVPVWVTPGIVTRMDRTAPPHLDRAVLGAGASLVELPDGGPPAFHVLHARPPGPPVYVVDPVTWAEVADPT